MKIRKSNNNVVSTDMETRVLLHCNWGWEGTNNGYFTPDVFNSSSPVVRDNNLVNSGTSAYQYSIGNILNIHP